LSFLGSSLLVKKRDGGHLPGSYEIEEIFPGGSTCPLNIRQVFMPKKGRPLALPLFFWCLSLRLLPLCLGISKQGRAEGLTLLLHIDRKV